MERAIWDYGCATARTRLDAKGVLEVTMRGLVTGAVFAALRRDLRDVAERDFDGNGAVIDFGQAMLINIPLEELLTPQPVSRVDGMAVALLVPEGDGSDLARFAELCDWNAEDGRVSAVFTESRPAFAWAQARGLALALAQHLAQQREDLPSPRAPVPE